MSEWAHPAWPYLAAALLALALPARARPALLAAPALAVVLAWSLPDGGTLTGRVMGVELLLVRADALSRMFAIVFALIGGLAGLYAGPGAGRRLYVAGFAATAAGLVIVLAGDWITLYLGWEALAIASFAIVTDGGTPRAWQAAYRYLLVHFAGDALLLAGIAWHLASGGSGLVGALPADGARLLFLVADFDLTTCRAVARRLAENRTWVVPTLIATSPWYRMPDEPFGPHPLQVTPWQARYWAETHRTIEGYTEQQRAALQMLWTQILKVIEVLHESGVLLLAGSDPPNEPAYFGIGLHDELALLVSAGLTPAEALHTATVAPARYFGAEGELGTIAAGKLARLSRRAATLTPLP
jgi:hypothetical protein